MRAVVLAILLAPTLAAAEPATTRCYAGTQAIKSVKGDDTVKLVIERTLDPAASEVREHAWSSKEPEKPKDMVAKVDAKAGTFTFEDSENGVTGAGKLEGKPWRWTGQTMTGTKGKLDLQLSSKLEGDKVHSTLTVTAGGKQVVSAIGELSAFDCAKLAEQRAALKK